MAYEEKNIADILEEIDSKKIYLPAIQRKYIWKESQIVKLMDSIMQGYPFGTFLFWKVKKRTVNDKKYSMYEFIKNYHERDNYKNMPAAQPFSVSEENANDTIFSVLDGQQRLTSLYIALKGSLSLKLPKKHWSSDDAFPRKELYFDLYSKKINDDDEQKYNFAFLTNDEASIKDVHLWYRVKDIMQYVDQTEVMMKLVNKRGWGQDELVMDNIFKLHQRLKSEKLINFFEIEKESIDDVLDIFVRVNSGGTVLSKTDLLFSTIVSYWDKGRDEIDSFLSHINKIGDHYNFGTDFIMRNCLYVKDLPVTLKVESFGSESVGKIKKDWNRIKSAIEDTVKLLDELGFNSENIVAENAIIPIIYYRYKYGEEAFTGDVSVKFEIRKYLVISQIKHIYGQSTGSTLSIIRNELKKYLGKPAYKFKMSWLEDCKFAGGSNLSYTAEDIESWFDTYEKGAYTFMLLSLLYPNLKYSQKGFHQDHMHPASAFDKDDELLKLRLPNGSCLSPDKVDEWKRKRNTLANLQLLEGRENESKNAEPFVEWLQKPENSDNVKFLPAGISYELANFDEFMEKRKEIMFKKLKEILMTSSEKI